MDSIWENVKTLIIKIFKYNKSIIRNKGIKDVNIIEIA